MASYHFGNIRIATAENAIDLGGATVTNSGTTSEATALVTKTYVDSLVQTQETRINTALDEIQEMIGQVCNPDTGAIQAETTRALAAELALRSAINYNAVASLSRNVFGVAPTTLPESQDYNGWYFRPDGSSGLRVGFVSAWALSVETPVSVYFNCKLLATAAVPTVRITGPHGEWQVAYGISPAARGALVAGGCYTFYSSTTPNAMTPGHTPVRLESVSGAVGLTGASSVELYLPDPSGLDIVVSQLGVVSGRGTQNILMENDSVVALETRRRLDVLYQYFFRQDSSLDPGTD